MRRAAGQEDGFALVTALVAVLLFALTAYTVLASDRGAVAELDAQIERARLEAAADAALATAAAGLGAASNRRWPIDGRPQELSIDGLEVAVALEDERGKAPLNNLQPAQARRLLQAVGVSASRLNGLTDSLLSWKDGFSRPNAAKPLDYAPDGVQPRNGPFVTVGELAAVKGMTPELLARIAPALTVFQGNGAFAPQVATPLALTAMTETGGEGPDAIIRARELAGQRAKLDSSAESYLGRVVTVRVSVRSPRGGALERATILEMTGAARRPIWVRATD